MKRAIFVFAVVGLLCSVAAATNPEALPSMTTIAVAGFNGTSDTDRLGDFAFEVLQNELAAQSGFELVDRARLHDVLAEQQLGAAGLAGENAAQIGRLVGAKYYVFGSSLRAGEHVAINCRVVQVESGVLVPILVSIAKDEDPMMVGKRLALQTKQAIEKLAGRPAIAAKDSAPLFSWPEGLPHPILAYRIPEASATPNAARPDPTAEKALEGFYFDHGFKSVQLSRPSQGGAPSFVGQSLAPALHLEGPEHEALLEEARGKGVDVIVLGIAVSDRATRIGPFAAARARVEIAAIDTRTSKVLATANGYGTGTDLSDFVAEKKAIASATELLLTSFSTKMANSLGR